ncbi:MULTISPECIES: SH3 domain-containing protein [unclassified Herbaspirillum]|uniref:SH3 domain-containing protein n=1 Tax=unclassified Herbaspirillum TaxID=2624150 RepID=UPI0011532BC4|nr:MULTISPECIES: SH3 domain-containing protein [unclassified Herbaspirillum]MBB5393685.1 SH3-like domain-containing protein [Herbaspirillum sp. SJZ102]TQK01453.1 SH3 domain-containing protein [Herbaspirillum sp. SJZ130]TQK05849.1 SH3 domain-containing protein [Herbaspirillum sp. SJZ106]
MKRLPLILCATVLGAAAFAPNAFALDFKSVGASPSVMYDAPSEKGRRVYVAPRGMPVEVVLTYGEWSKVRDAAGTLSWIQSKALTPKRMLVVSAANARIFNAADESSPVVFTADRNVLLEMVESPNNGWVKVRHRDGQTGFARVADVWGD